MAEHLVPIKKESGGSTISGPDGTEYTWKKDGDVVDVPYDFALELLAVRGGGFEVADEKKAQAAAKDHAVVSQSADAGHADTERRQVIEPGPGKSVADRMVTEPVPDAGVIEGGAAPENPGSPITPRVRAGTQKNRSAK